MRVDMYLRTYQGDYKWLPYLFASIRKFATGYDRIIVQAPHFQPRPPVPNWPSVVFIPGPSYGTDKNPRTGMPDDYNGQQVDKLAAWQHAGETTDAILFLDSDCVFTRPVDVSKDPDLWSAGRPIRWWTPWEDVGDAQCWREPVGAILGWDPEAETMRRHPMIHTYDVLHGLASHLWCEVALGLMDRDRISEFNLMGNFALARWRDKYAPRDTRAGMPAPLMRQFHSWSGLTDEVKAELKAILGEDCP